jgi:aminopeptidase-like protein
MLDFVRELYPVCRSITGAGVRRTLARMRAAGVPLQVHEVATGTPVFDWTVPLEWNVRGAWLDDPDGRRVVDFADHSLHLMSYSIPYEGELGLEELKPHLHTLPAHPDWIPYRTSYYTAKWGLCMSHRQYAALRPGRYRVCIDTDLSPGHLSYGELEIPGASAEEILIYSHLCHPSLANDNLSGLAVTLWWAKALLSQPQRRYTYRFVWGPGPIGSLTWLALNRARWSRIRHGLVAVLLGRPGTFHYKRTRVGDAEIDRAATLALREHAPDAVVRDFEPYGYDERQFGSPGIRLNVGRLTRVPNGEYPEYHSSADNVDLVTAEALTGSLDMCRTITGVLEQNQVFHNLAPFGEPQLGKRGLYRAVGGDNPPQREYAMLWLLNQSDGEHALLDIAERSGLSFGLLASTARELVQAGLLRAASNAEEGS